MEQFDGRTGCRHTNAQDVLLGGQVVGRRYPLEIGEVILGAVGQLVFASSIVDFLDGRIGPQRLDVRHVGLVERCDRFEVDRSHNVGSLPIRRVAVLDVECVHRFDHGL